jgi:plastocyanin
MMMAITAGLVGTALGCSNLPAMTRTGAVKDIVISDHVAPWEVKVNAGDEVRWINKRSGPIRVVFLDQVGKRLSCNNGFGGLTVKAGAASLDPDESASLCFSNPGTYRYTIRMESASTTGELDAPGVIKVGDMGG